MMQTAAVVAERSSSCDAGTRRAKFPAQTSSGCVSSPEPISGRKGVDALREFGTARADDSDPWNIPAAPRNCTYRKCGTASNARPRDCARSVVSSASGAL